MRQARIAASAVATVVAFSTCYQAESDRCPSGQFVCPPGWTCAINDRNKEICVRPTCGNGRLDPGELCDDGNTSAGDGCSTDCSSTEICGNAIVDADLGEVCDDGNRASGDGCSSDCRSGEGCGNGLADPGETCDDGNLSDEDNCTTTCQVAFCGDGFTNNSGTPDGGRKEHCDDGNTSTCGTCNSSCTVNQISAATGRITAVDGTRLVDGETFTISDGNVSKLFELDVDGGVAPGHIPVLFSGRNAGQVASEIAAGITGSALNLQVSTTGNDVNLANPWAGGSGNQPITETVADPGFAVVGLFGGTGRDCPVGTGCTTDLDCVPGRVCSGPAGGKTCQ